MPANINPIFAAIVEASLRPPEPVQPTYLVLHPAEYAYYKETGELCAHEVIPPGPTPFEPAPVLIKLLW